MRPGTFRFVCLISIFAAISAAEARNIDVDVDRRGLLYAQKASEKLLDEFAVERESRCMLPRCRTRNEKKGAFSDDSGEAQWHNDPRYSHDDNHAQWLNEPPHDADDENSAQWHNGPHYADDSGEAQWHNEPPHDADDENSAQLYDRPLYAHDKNNAQWHNDPPYGSDDTDRAQQMQRKHSHVGEDLNSQKKRSQDYEVSADRILNLLKSKKEKDQKDAE